MVGEAISPPASCGNSESLVSDEAEDILNHLPLPLLRSQLIPPAPNRRRSAVDFLYDFGGASWVAYGASSLLVISHFPSPVPDHENLVGPFFRQVIEPPTCLDAGGIDDVNAVSWCPALPSEGMVAAAQGNYIWLYMPHPDVDTGSLSWRQIAGIMHPSMVDAIEWTGSGDGLVAAGIDVSFWRRKGNSWEMAWKSAADVPQVCVSAAWSAEGPVATTAGCLLTPGEMGAQKFSNLDNMDCRHVSVYHSDGKSQVTKTELRHSQPVSLIRWRPASFIKFTKDALRLWRDLLLTCCLDGTVRLWSEIDNGKHRKVSKDTDHRVRQPFQVVAVIEIEQCLNGTLGLDIFIDWVVDLPCAISKSKGGSLSLSPGSSKHDQIASCEWLISVGPVNTVTLWAVHCLDDAATFRSPRVTLWRKQNPADLKACSFSNYQSMHSAEKPMLLKVVAMRRQLFGPPLACSLIQLLPDNSISWWHFYSPSIDEHGSLALVSKEKCLSYFKDSVLNLDGHSANIVQLTLLPYSHKPELAVSLDSNGFLFFWSISKHFNFPLEMQMYIYPTWKLLKKVKSQDLSTDLKYLTMACAHFDLDEKPLLFLGYDDGIDCFLIEVSGEEEYISCHKIFSVSFSGHKHIEGSPDHIFSTPIASLSRCFLLYGVWVKEFRTISWKIILQPEVLVGSACKLTLDFETASRLKNIHRSISYGGKTYAVTICASSWNLPFSQNSKTAFCVSMVSPDHFMASNRSNVVSDNGSHRNSFSLLATGYSDGILELWKVFSEKPLESECLPWVLVGKIAAHDGPVNAVSVSNCGGKIATVSISDINSMTVLHIWTPLCLMGSGTFILEDVLLFNKPVVSLKWAILGNGKLLLGVCMSNEFHIYCERRFHDFLMESDNYKESHAWCCISLSHFFHHCHDFQWGPMLTPVFLHERKISVFCEWLSEMESKHIGEISSIYTATTEKCCGITIKNNVHGANEVNQSDKKNGIVLSVLSSSSFLQECSSKNRNSFHCLMDMVERLCRPLESHHPWELLQYLYRGNWKHVYFVMKHLVDSLTHVDASTAQLEHHSSRKLFYIPHVSKYFDGMTPKEKANNTFQWGKGISSGSTIFKENISQFEDTLNPRICKDFSLTNNLKSEIMEFIDFLEKSSKLTGLTNLEKIHMLTVLDFLLELSNTSLTSLYESLDEPGQRFWVSVRFQHLLFRRKVGSVASVEDFAVDSWLVAWAFHSDCQENLLNSLLSTESSWPEMRNLGMGYWFTNLSKLRTRMEKLARLQYLKRKNPRDCALLYLALKKVQVLAGLFKISKDENDKILFEFLSRNFQEEKNKAAALKNAYVLMGRHQLELAVSFFLLGGDPSSAVSVCAKNLGDEQLALIICRLLEGYGGPLEKQLISTILLPNAIENKDYWLSSILDWSLGNYFESVTRLFKSLLHCTNHVASRNCSYISVADPHIGRYCVLLASKHCLKNTIGANVASVLSKFATMLDSYSLNRYGLPMEALECFVSYTMEGNSQDNTQDIDAIFQELLDPFYTANGTQTWLQEDIAHHFESHFKLSLAMQYISCFVSELPWWAYRRNPVTLTELIKLDDSDCDLDKHKALEYSREKLNVVILAFERRYSLKLVDLANMVLLYACNNGLLFLGYQLLHRLIFWGHEADDHPKADHCSLCSIAPGFIVKANKELFYAYSRYVVCCHFSDSALKQLCGRGSTTENCSTIIIQRNFCLQYLICSLRIVKPLLNCCDHLLSSASFFELIGYMMFFSYHWFSRNLSGLIQLLFQIHRVFVSNQDSIDVVPGELMKLLNHTSVCSTSDVSTDNEDVLQDFINKKEQVKRSNSSEFSIPENEIWLFMGTSFWMQNTKLTNQQYSKLLTTHKLKAERSMTDNNQFFLTVAKLAMVSVAYVSSSLTKHLASFLREKASKGSPVAAFSLFEESNQLELCSLIHDFDPESRKLSASGDKKALAEMLWKCVNAKEIYQNLSNEKIYGFTYNSEELFSFWIDFKKFNFFEHENDDNSQYTSGGNFSSGTSNALGSARNYLDVSTFLGTSRNSNSKLETTNFCNPIEIAKKSGELLEAICINSINEHQLAATSNRKGLFFFNWKMEPALKEKALHIWLEADWPFDGWTDADFAHTPTCVSPGAGIGNKSGVHVGLGEATVGLGSMARPVKELTGGAAFGIPGYAGIGASGLDWGGEIQFDEFLDGSATVQNMNSRALCSHPSRPFLLVGSVNTLVYLWKFGTDKATATYGFLPAVNVRSHQAHATISDLEFDRCGHRFATAALDGTVCTWQLEVEGKTNTRPMESSLCFNNQASDVAFLAASGSILAAAGCSTNGHNVVLWDTLAPPGTSQASLICHEGGARSLSVFDNDVGSGSISPLIVTGGKGGDVGLHDFRFIATGKSNRHRQLQDQNFKSSSFISTFKHVDNTNGMIWYIPKAHSGSIMKIATIPDTSMFLTGGKDGDVKLWDAKRERLVFHWQRIHDRHTFIQPNTKGIGGIVRAAVTDIRVFSSGFITCGGDGSVKLVQLK